MILCAGPGKFNLESLSATLEIIILNIYFASQKQNQNRSFASKEVELVHVLLGARSTPKLLYQKSILAYSFISTLQIPSLRGFL